MKKLTLILTLLIAAFCVAHAQYELPWDGLKIFRAYWLADMDTVPGGIGVEETQVYYVGKHGSDIKSGKSLGAAMLTFGTAIDSALAQTPAAGSEIAIVCMDAGFYTESCSIPSYVHVFAPDAQLRGQWYVTDHSMFDFNGISCGAGSTAISKVAGSGEAHVKFDNVTGTGTASGFICTAGAMQARGGIIDVENGFGFGASSTDNMHVRCSRISVSGTGYAIGTAGAGSVRADVNAIVAPGGIGIYAASNANVYVTAATIVAGTAYNVAAATDSLWITCPSITGTRTNNGTVVEISNELVTTNKGVFNDSARTSTFVAGHAYKSSAAVADSEFATVRFVRDSGGGQRITRQELTDGASIAWDLAGGPHAYVTLGGNRALSNPSNLVAGEMCSITIIQDGTGGRTLTWGADYLFPGDVSPTLTATASAKDVVMFLSDGTDLNCVTATADVK